MNKKVKQISIVTLILSAMATGLYLLQMPISYVVALVTVVWVNMTFFIIGKSPLQSFTTFTISFICSLLIGSAALLITTAG